MKSFSTFLVSLDYYTPGCACNSIYSTPFVYVTQPRLESKNLSHVSVLGPEAMLHKLPPPTFLPPHQSSLEAMELKKQQCLTAS
jgi:hypothetical protein